MARSRHTEMTPTELVISFVLIVGALILLIVGVHFAHESGMKKCIERRMNENNDPRKLAVQKCKVSEAEKWGEVAEYVMDQLQ